MECVRHSRRGGESDRHSTEFSNTEERKESRALFLLHAIVVEEKESKVYLGQQ